MLILGTRYGSLEPKSGLSYTEVEYDYAVSVNKPYFALVVGDEAVDRKLKSVGGQFIEKEQPQRLKDFREKVLAKMCSIYADTRDIKSHVYENLIEIASKRELEGWVRGSLVVDTTDLHDRISGLAAENERLKEEIAEARLTASPSQNLSNFSRLESILKGIHLEPPAEFRDSGTSPMRDINGLFLANRNLLVKGFAVSHNSAPKSKWFLDNVYTVLATHKLANADLVGDARRIVLTEKGLDYLAWIDSVKTTELN